MTDFTQAPIIVVGAFHAGTRAVVKILSELGSDQGRDCEPSNQENLLFQRVHIELVESIDPARSWGELINDPRLMESFQDDGSFAERMIARLGSEFAQEFPHHQSRPWHWKCPASALFLESWRRVYPHARYVHIHRDPYEVAESFVRRREMVNPLRAVRLVGAINRRIREADLDNLFRLDYSRATSQVRDLAEFLDLSCDAVSLANAERQFSVPQRSRWDRTHSLRTNLWRKAVANSIKAMRIICPIPAEQLP